MKVALVHDYLTQYGGGERTLEALAELFPDAPIFTLLYTPERLMGRFGDRDIRASFLQRLPFVPRHHRLFPWLMPLACEHLDLSGFDLLVSDSASFVKGVIAGPSAVHISYCHTPLRYAWDDSHRYVAEYQSFPRFLKIFTPAALSFLRLWDYTAAQRPDVLVANSRYVARRIQKYYGREAPVVYPPVNVSFFNQFQREPQEYVLMVGRLLAYKRFSLGIEACRRAGLSLHIVGEGPELANLKKEARGADVTFLGEISDDEALGQEYAHCRCFLFPQEEDFGIVAVEAMASGAPVIALHKGGASEIVEEGKSGMFVNEETPEAFAAALRVFDPYLFDEQHVRASAARFDRAHFLQNMNNLITETLDSRL